MRPMSENSGRADDVALVPGSIASHLSCLLVKLGQVSFRLQEAALAPLDLRVRHFSVLQGLADRGPSVQLELGRYLRIDPATMAAVLDDLGRIEAVSRERSPEDRRRYIVTLTAEGEGLLSRAVAAIEAVDATFRADLQHKPASDLLEDLRHLAADPALAAAFDTAADRRTPNR